MRVLTDRNTQTNNRFWFIAGLAIGPVLMYFLDPSEGRRRRAYVRDKGIHLTHVIYRETERQSRNFRQRMEGAFARISDLIDRDVAPDDSVLVERVRAAMGRKTSHPRAIEVEVHDGTVVLRGQASSQEIKPLFNCVRRVKGVRRVVNRLSLRDQQTTVDVPVRHGRHGQRQAQRQGLEGHGQQPQQPPQQQLP